MKKIKFKFSEGFFSKPIEKEGILLGVIAYSHSRLKYFVIFSEGKILDIFEQDILEIDGEKVR